MIGPPRVASAERAKRVVTLVRNVRDKVLFTDKFSKSGIDNFL